MSIILSTLAGVAAASMGASDLPEVKLAEVPMRVEKSCRVVIEPGRVLEGGEAGVIQVAADGITVEFADGSVLRGAPVERGLDELPGTGIVVEGHKGVTLRGVRVSGYKVGVRAVNAPGLMIDGGTFEGMYAQRLRSTPAAEDSGDWLWPHKNDGDEWTKTYGAAVSVKNATGVTIRGVKVRRGQNGILLSRVDDSKIYDNDCSFLSGWGLGMWRSSGNVVSRNALDFCIRGYSHGVYNRGQDSAGILMFEQCCRNVIAENSVTHGGDGLFGFAGREALGEDWAEGHKGEAVREEVAAAHSGKGCNENVVVGNDFSYAAAHGIEMTFSFGNWFENNRLVGNGICGVWGGYSARTVIVGNTIARNGPATGGRVGEGGGVNIEHGRDNRITSNNFSENALGVRVWAVPSPSLEAGLWGLGNAEKDADGHLRVPSARNEIVSNTFERERLGVHVRDSVGTVFGLNVMRNVERETDADGPLQAPPKDWYLPPRAKVEFIGERRPVGALRSIDGREQIVMGEWGPWDHVAPMLRLRGTEQASVVYDVFASKAEVVEAVVLEGKAWAFVDQATSLKDSGGRGRVRIDAGGSGPGVWPYRARIQGKQGGFSWIVSGTIVNAAWSVTVFPWEHDPLRDAAAWRVEAGGEKAVKCEVERIQWPFGYAGPGVIAPVVKEAKFGANKYGVMARTKLPLGAGEWVVKTLSDDGVRVIADGKTIIERWDIHGPTADRGVIAVEKEHEVEIVVEYFQNDGFATLSVGIEKTGEK
jgi:hypothetical protein